MAEAILKTNQPDKVPEVLNDAINTEKSRLKYSLKCTWSLYPVLRGID